MPQRTRSAIVDLPERTIEGTFLGDGTANRGYRPGQACDATGIAVPTQKC